jgi:hypothetical protein
VTYRHALLREALLSAVAAAAVAAMLVWLGPPGTDFAAHAYQRTLFLQHGFVLWNNFWYAGRYSFVTYSVLYYPLAAWLGIKLLAVATVALSALAFAVVLWREWGPTARWSSRTFAVVWAGIVLSAAFPFALGFALALLAIWALQAGARWRFAALATLALAASPLAFLLLVVVLAGVALAHRETLRRNWLPVVAILLAGVTEAVLWRVFPGGGRFPFSLPEAAAGVAFCVLGLVFTWRVESARVLRFVFALAVAWNTAPLASSFVKNRSDVTANAATWPAAIGFLQKHLAPSYRVEAVDTATHWPASYLATAGIPIARGWYRQADFPQNAVLYDDELGPKAYLRWLRGLGVRYVVLPHARLDYSARGEGEIVRSGRAGLRPVFRTKELTIYAVPRPTRIVTGPGYPSLAWLTESRIGVVLRRGGDYRIAVRWSPYWRASHGCLRQGRDGMLRLTTRQARTVRIVFDVDAKRAIAELAGETTDCSLR